MTRMTENSKGWIFFTYISFALATMTTLMGVWLIEMPLAMKGFVSMGVLFTTGSAFTLAKTLRDEHEAQKLHNQIDEARTEKLLREVEQG